MYYINMIYEWDNEKNETTESVLFLPEKQRRRKADEGTSKNFSF